MFRVLAKAVTNVMPPVEKTPGFLQYIDVTARIAFFILTLFVGIVAFEGQSLLRSVADHEKRITTIEANRYTSADGLEDARRYSEDMAKMRTWIEASYPPDWLREDVQELKQDVADLRQLMLQHEIVPRPKAMTAKES